MVALLDLRRDFVAEVQTRIGPVVRPVAPNVQVLHQEWLASVTFTGPRLTLVTSFGDRESIVNSVLSRTGDGPVLAEAALWEWLEALGIDDDRSSCEILLTQRGDIERVVQETAGLLADHLPEILDATPDVAAAIARARHQRAEDDFQVQVSGQAAQAIVEARRAFWRRDYGRVVELLEPWESRLSRAERR